MSWWHKIGAESDEDPPVHAPGRSVYEERNLPVADDRPTYTANVMGNLVQLPACCVNPAQCERPECWTPLAPSLDGIRGVR